MTNRRYIITADDDNRCSLRLRGGTEIRFWAPLAGGYVRDTTDNPGTLGRQVCDGLQGMGPTLHWSGRGELADLIRSEARSAAGSRTINFWLETDR